jgi:phosphate-selective porin OprO/OprP
MNLINKIITGLTLVLFTLSLTNLSRADAHSDRLDKIESQVQDALIKMKGLEKKTKDTPSIKIGPGFKAKSGKNQFKLGGRIHFDIGSYDSADGATCQAAHSITDSSCLVNGTNFRRLRIAVSGKYDSMFYYKASVDWGASAKQGTDNTDNASVDEAFLGYKLAKNTTFSLGKQKMPVAFAESTSSNDMAFIERPPSLDALTDETIGPKRMGAQLRNWDKKMGYLVELGMHGSGDTFETELTNEDFGLGARVAYAPILSKKQVLHLGYWHNKTLVDETRFGAASGVGTRDLQWNYRTGLNVSDEKFLDMEDDADDKGGWTDMIHYGAEFAYLFGPAWVQAEWIWGEMNRAVMPGDTNTFTSYKANGGYYQFGYVIGSERRYTIKKGGWKAPKVKNPVSKGGSGVHEIVLRRDQLSLNDLADSASSGFSIDEGTQKTWTLGYNWYLNNSNRIMVNYINVDVDCEAVKNVSKLDCGATSNGITNNPDDYTTIKVLGVRFQTKW